MSFIRLQYVTLLFAAIAAFPATHLEAAPPLRPEFDGRVIEYDTTDLRGSFVGTPAWPGAAMSNLYVSWDATNLYIALTCRMNDTKVSVLLDVDSGNGTGATTTTNWVAGNNVMFYYNDNGWRKAEGPGAKSFGLDFMIATEGFYNSVTLALYNGVEIPNTNSGRRLFDLPDVGNGNIPVGTAVEMVVLRDGTTNKLKGFETRIPWNVLYGMNTNRFGYLAPGKVVPTGATVRLFANIHNNLPNLSFSAPDTIPPQTSSNASYNAITGLLVTDDYIDVLIDGDHDGFPDLGAGDVNAPYLTSMIAVAGSVTITGVFNEAVTEATATIASNWNIAGMTVDHVEQRSDNRLAVQLTQPLPPSGSLLYVTTRGVEDYAGNSREAENYVVTRATPYLSGYQSMAVAGDFQGWNPSAMNMRQVRDYTWLYDVTILSSSGIQFKFAANGAWDINFGRGSLFSSPLPIIDSAGSAGGANIRATNGFSGSFRFMFNEQTKAFSLVKSGSDSDHDGLPDEWETYYGLSPVDSGTGLSVNGASGDIDSDSVNNAGEYNADTDPGDSFSYPSTDRILRQPGGVDITFATSSNRSYTVEASESSAPPWSSITAADVPGSGLPMTVTDTNDGAMRIYRVRVHNP